MFSNITMADPILSALVAVGAFQMAWLSVMLFRRGIHPTNIQYALTPMLTIWVLMWPVYTDARWLWVGLVGFAVPSLFACVLKLLFWQHLRVIWTAPALDSPIRDNIDLPPLTHLIIAILIAGAWFQAIPEFGFGLALCLSLAFPAVHWVDQFGRDKFRKLGFPTHPEQTLAGHLTLIFICTGLLCWSLNVYHGTNWQTLFIATLITGMAASATHALTPGQWNTPAAMLSMGFVMWIL
jgi:ABC-type xylose transport system permease subunit